MPCAGLRQTMAFVTWPVRGDFSCGTTDQLPPMQVEGATSSQVYDGDGKRTSKTVGGSTTSHLYDVNASLPVLLDDGTRKYVWGLRLAYAVDTSGNVLVYHTDGLGSVRALTDGFGNVVQTYQYDEYGNVTSSQGSVTQPFQYTGEQCDDYIKLVYLRARYYDPETGRFLSGDAIAGDTHDPLSLHRYSYVSANPIDVVDPSGLKSLALSRFPVATANATNPGDLLRQLLELLKWGYQQGMTYSPRALREQVGCSRRSWLDLQASPIRRR